MKVRYSNNAATVLSANVEPGHTVLIVESASQFPILSNGDWMYVTVEEEAIKVSNTSGNVFTCEPFAQYHGVGSSVECRITAGVMDDAQDADVYTSSGDKPPNGAMRTGEIYANVKDVQIGIGDESGNPQEMVAVRFHNSQASYVVDDLVSYGGGIWRCMLTHTGAWNENNWEQISGGGGGLEWVTSPSGNVSAEASKGYFVYTNSGTRIVNLPAGVVGDTIGVNDVSNNCSVNNITIVSSGSEKIMGEIENFVMDVNASSIHFTYADSTTGWAITGGNW
ncbi:MAG TPA: hypothetical protein EYP35_02400 [Desulfobacterales bacterium]|nr:hypothetical protein [Desulfobacterales bacterium]